MSSLAEMIYGQAASEDPDNDEKIGDDDGSTDDQVVQTIKKNYDSDESTNSSIERTGKKQRKQRVSNINPDYDEDDDEEDDDDDDGVNKEDEVGVKYFADDANYDDDDNEYDPDRILRIAQSRIDYSYNTSNEEDKGTRSVETTEPGGDEDDNHGDETKKDGFSRKSSWLHYTSNQNRKQPVQYVQKRERKANEKVKKDETEEEFRIRIRRKITQMEFHKIRKNWKKRKYHLFSEQNDAIDDEDINENDGTNAGNANDDAITNHVSAAEKIISKVEKEHEKRKKRHRLENQRDALLQDNTIVSVEAKVADEDLEMNLVLNEEFEFDDQRQQDVIFNQLVQPMRDRRATKKARGVDEDDDDVVFSNWEKLYNLDHARRGLITSSRRKRRPLISTAVSATKQLDEQSSPILMTRAALGRVHKMLLRQSSNRDDGARDENGDVIIREEADDLDARYEDDDGDHCVTLKSFPKISAPYNHDNSRLQRFRLSSSATFNQFSHNRNVLRLAARQIYSDVGDRVQCTTTDRLIHLLWNKSLIELQGMGELGRMTHANRIDCVLAQASEIGCNMRLFYEYLWNNRRQAAVSLGVACNAITGNDLFQLVGCEHNIGTNLRRRFLHDRNTFRRTRIVQSMAKLNTVTRQAEKLEWIPNSMASEEDNEENEEHNEKSEYRELFEYLNTNGCVRKPIYSDQFTATDANHRFVPGIVPSVPTFPLDEAGIIFGPKHPFHSIVVSGRISEVTLKLTIASVISKMGTTKSSLCNKLLQKQLWSVMITAVRLNQKKSYIRLQRLSKPVHELPLSCFYRTLMDFCSLVCNGFLTIKADECDEELDTSFKRNYDDGSDESVDTQEKNDPQQVHDAVTTLYEFLHDHIEHNGLQMFGRIHILYGLLRIASHLPASAVEILSKPLDTKSYRTPFEILRQCLQHLEDSGSLVDSGPYGRDTDRYVVAVQLEFEMHEAATRFARCVERDPTDIDYLCWYVGTLTACVIVTSGNRIGSGAHLFPSALLEHGRSSQSSMSDGNSSSLGAHEVRQALPSFQELRCETLKALKVLFHVGKRQNGLRGHIAITKYLEWSEAIALLLGPIYDEDVEASTYDSICSLHKHHASSWLLQESSPTDIDAYLSSTAEDANIRLHSLAAMLENNPCVKANWIAFVDELGPVRCNESRNDCDGLEVHGHSNENWWGEDRCNWWTHNVLRLSLPEATFPRQFPVSKDDICALLTNAMKDFEVFQSRSFLYSESGSNNISFGWIDEAIERASSAENDDVSLMERKLKIDECLPQPFLGNKLETAIRHASSKKFAQVKYNGEEAEAFEMFSYKTLILCHLKSVCHPTVEKTIVELILRGWKDKALMLESNAFRCLTWLYKMGIDVPEIVLRGNSWR